MIARYGERFIEAGQFESYCRGLNVHLDLHELERRERSGAMLPMMRVVYPAEYAEQKIRGPRPLDMSQWPEIQSLSDPARRGPDDFRSMPDEEMIHPFDREIGRNSLLARPIVGNFQPWCIYPRFSVEHYYSYWQVHRLYALKHMPANLDWEQFEWLSFWVTMYRRERMRTVAMATEPGSYADFGNSPVALTKQSSSAYRRRLKKHAKHVQERFGIGTELCYDFLLQLINAYEDYQHDERYRLAKEIQKDILNLAEFISLNTGENWAEIADRIAIHGIWCKDALRSLQTSTRERDAAKRVLTGVRFVDEIRRGANEKSDEEIKKEIEVDTLLDYCEKHVSLLITALSGMQATGDQEFQEKDRAVIKYTNLKNILTSFEYLTKKIKKAARIKSGDSLRLMILALMEKESKMEKESWVAEFEKNQRMTYGSVKKLRKLVADTALDYTAKNFLIACAGRNFVVHNFPEQFEFGDGEIPRQSDFYGDLFGEILNAARYAILYTWRKARKENWVR